MHAGRRDAASPQGTRLRAGDVARGEHGLCEATASRPIAQSRPCSAVCCSHNRADTWQGVPRHSPLVSVAISVAAPPALPSGGRFLSPGTAAVPAIPTAIPTAIPVAVPHGHPHGHHRAGRQEAGRKQRPPDAGNAGGCWSRREPAAQPSASTSPENTQNKPFVRVLHLFGEFFFAIMFFAPHSANRDGLKRDTPQAPLSSQA